MEISITTKAVIESFKNIMLAILTALLAAFFIFHWIEPRIQSIENLLILRMHQETNPQYLKHNNKKEDRI